MSTTGLHAIFDKPLDLTLKKRENNRNANGKRNTQDTLNFKIDLNDKKEKLNLEDDSAKWIRTSEVFIPDLIPHIPEARVLSNYILIIF